MSQVSISFTLGKASAANSANLMHNNRLFFAKNIHSKESCKNIDYKIQPLEDAYHELFSEAIEDYNAKQKVPCRRIHDYLLHITNGKREEPFYEIVVQFGDCKTALDPQINLQALLDDYMKNFQARNPNLHVFNAVLHLDEASPHLHIDFIPFYTKGRQRGLQKGVSMRAALQEQGFMAKNVGENQLTAWEASERKEMENILHQHGFSREEKRAKYTHMTVGEYKAMQDVKRMTQTLRQMQTVTPSEQSQESIRKLKQALLTAEQEAKKLKAEKRSPYPCFYYSDGEKLAFVQQKMQAEEIPFRETDTGFESPECFVKRIREIEKSYRAPSVNIRDKLREDIDRILYLSDSYEGFLTKFKSKGYEVKKGKYISVKPPYGERFIRLKSLGLFYDELGLKERLTDKKQFEENLRKRIQEQSTEKPSGYYALLTAWRYIVTFQTDVLPIQRKDASKIYCWSNDVELDRLLTLNRLLNEGMTIESLRTKAKKLEQDAKEKDDAVTKSKKDLKEVLEIKEKIEMIFEDKPSTRFTREEALAEVKKFNVQQSNYKNIYGVVKEFQDKLDQIASERRQISDEVKKVTDSLSIIERVRDGTYVPFLVEKEKLMRQTEVMGNGYVSYGAMMR